MVFLIRHRNKSGQKHGLSVSGDLQEQKEKHDLGVQEQHGENCDLVIFDKQLEEKEREHDLHVLVDLQEQTRQRPGLAVSGDVQEHNEEEHDFGVSDDQEELTEQQCDLGVFNGQQENTEGRCDLGVCDGLQKQNGRTFYDLSISADMAEGQNEEECDFTDDLQEQNRQKYDLGVSDDLKAQSEQQCDGLKEDIKQKYDLGVSDDLQKQTKQEWNLEVSSDLEEQRYDLCVCNGLQEQSEPAHNPCVSSNLQEYDIQLSDTHEQAEEEHKPGISDVLQIQERNKEKHGASASDHLRGKTDQGNDLGHFINVPGENQQQHLSDLWKKQKDCYFGDAVKQQQHQKVALVSPDDAQGHEKQHCSSSLSDLEQHKKEEDCRRHLQDGALAQPEAGGISPGSCCDQSLNRQAAVAVTVEMHSADVERGGKDGEPNPWTVLDEKQTLLETVTYKTGSSTSEAEVQTPVGTWMKAVRKHDAEKADSRSSQPDPGVRDVGTITEPGHHFPLGLKPSRQPVGPTALTTSLNESRFLEDFSAWWKEGGSQHLQASGPSRKEIPFQEQPVNASSVQTECRPYSREVGTQCTRLDWIVERYGRRKEPIGQDTESGDKRKAWAHNKVI